MVSNIHQMTKADDIKLCFGQVGKVLAVNYLYNSYREFTGHAEIEMGSLVEANQIVKHFDGRLADGQVLHVVIKPPTQKPVNKEVSSEHTPPSRNRQSTSHHVVEDRREEPSFRSSNGSRNGYNRASFNPYSRPSYRR
ncbi:hypothetical protein K502DRAFT_8265 [Neoconidiobolus thromboides FSU 785]|nr:hypothetical protein K502DRAFT_8265 [Neoconidiobolus thromboides FSU 785]